MKVVFKGAPSPLPQLLDQYEGLDHRSSKHCRRCGHRSPRTWEKRDSVCTIQILCFRCSLLITSSIKVHSLALNPVDSLYVGSPVAPPGRVVGSDFSGTVEKLGEGVTQWKVGDRVSGFNQGGKSDLGPDKLTPPDSICRGSSDMRESPPW